MRYSYAVFFLLLFIAPNVILSQESIYSPAFLKAAKYADRAELEICRNNLNLADRYYDSLFQAMPTPSGNDVWNRALLAHRLGKQTLHESLVRMLFYKGYSLERLAKCFDTSIVRKLITPDYLAKRQIIERYFENLQEDDQRTNISKVERPMEWVDTWISNIQKIMELAQQAEKDTASYFTIECSVPQVCILHFFMMWSFKLVKNNAFMASHPHFAIAQSIDFKALGVVPFLVEQVEKGNYSRESVAYNLNLTEYPFPYEVATQYQNEMLIFEPNLLRQGLLDTINSNREYLGVSSFQEYYTKARFIDSIYTEGKPFRVIPQDSSDIFYENQKKCVFKLASGYRTAMFFTIPDEAKQVLKEEKKKYFRSH